MGLERIQRGADYLLALRLGADPVGGLTGDDRPLAPAGFVHGHQTLPQKLAAQVGTGLYPDDGTGTLPAQADAAQDVVSLPADVLQDQDGSLSPIGMLLACRYDTSPDLWEVVEVIDYTPGSPPTVQVSRDLTHTWPSGAAFHLLYDVQFAEYVQLLAELSDGSVTAAVRPWFFAWTDDETLYRWPDQGPIAVEETGLTGSTQESSHCHAVPIVRRCRGWMGAKVQVASITGGTISLWGGRA